MNRHRKGELRGGQRIEDGEVYSVTDPLTQLADWRKRKEELVWEGEEVGAELDRLIAEARNAGASVNEIARVTGYSRQRIYQRMEKVKG